VNREPKQHGILYMPVAYIRQHAEGPSVPCKMEVFDESSTSKGLLMASYYDHKPQSRIASDIQQRWQAWVQNGGQFRESGHVRCCLSEGTERA
jgi:hypothetical protein